MVTTQSLDEWADSDFLLVSEVQNGDVIEVKECIGLIESFGKTKFQLIVEFKGKKKVLNVNRFQYRQMNGARAGGLTGGMYEIQKVAVNGGTALNFKALN